MAVALITGASSGIGWELALALARDGFQVGLVARSADKLAELQQVIEASGGRAAIAVADVSQREQMFTAAEKIRADLGPIDLLVANAGISQPEELEPFPLEVIERTMQVNFMGVVHAIAAVLPEMLARRQGHLAAVSSLASYRGFPGFASYCASKAAINAYLEGLRVQLHDRGISVTTICPGFVRTPIIDVNTFPMPFVLEPNEAARRITRALRRRRKIFNFPWPMTRLIKFSRRLPDSWIAFAKEMRKKK
jgi:short-subunit dehydrogenase